MCPTNSDLEQIIKEGASLVLCLRISYIVLLSFAVAVAGLWVYFAIRRLG